MIGRSLGRYQIVAPIGRGGMASVWRARDTLLGHDVAIKTLSEELAQSHEARRRFRHEAAIATRLSHPFIVPVFEHGEDDGVEWIAMQLIAGETLAQRIARSLVPIADVLRVGRQTAEALGYAHEQGVVHRDVSPSNIMLTTDGRAVVLDFGLARADDLSRVSHSGQTLGTLAYASPEVQQGCEADARSDLYSLGVVLYEALTGMRPFSGDRLETLTLASTHGAPPPPSTRRAGVPAVLDALILRLLAPSPEVRPADAATLLRELEAVQDEFDHAPAAAPAPGAQVRPVGAGFPVYLGLLPFAAHPPTDERIVRLAAEFSAALRRRLPSLGRLHTLTAERTPGESDGAFASRAGANVLLGGSVRSSAATLRVEWTLLGASGEDVIAGFAVDGSVHDPFAIEDELVAGIRAALDLPAESGALTAPLRGRDPAAAEHLAQAMRYLARNDDPAAVDGAIALLERLAATREPAAGWLAALAHAYVAKYRLTNERPWEARAATACRRAIEISPSDPDVLVALGELQALAGRHDEAVASFQSALDQAPERVEAWLALAAALDRIGRSTDAEQACRRAVALSPTDWRAWSRLGRVFFRRGEYEAALQPWHEALQLTRDNALVAINIGSALFVLGRFDEAVAAYHEAMRIRPTARGFSNLGAALHAAGRFADAATALERATALEPNVAKHWGNLAAALRVLPGREGEARAARERAIALQREQLARNPDEPELWAALADWLQMAGDAGAASEALARALEMAPGNVECMLRAAYVHQERGDREGVLRWLARAIEHGYSPDLLRRSPSFAPLRDDPAFERLLASAPPRAAPVDPE